jgi:hypothetical protein
VFSRLIKGTIIKGTKQNLFSKQTTAVFMTYLFLFFDNSNHLFSGTLLCFDCSFLCKSNEAKSFLSFFKTQKRSHHNKGSESVPKNKHGFQLELSLICWKVISFSFLILSHELSLFPITFLFFIQLFLDLLFISVCY